MSQWVMVVVICLVYLGLGYRHTVYSTPTILYSLFSILLYYYYIFSIMFYDNAESLLVSASL